MHSGLLRTFCEFSNAWLAHPVTVNQPKTNSLLTLIINIEFHYGLGLSSQSSKNFLRNSGVRISIECIVATLSVKHFSLPVV